MDQLFFLLSVVLLSVSKSQSWTAPDFCHQRECPQFEVVATNKEFEERRYVATTWISTEFKGYDIPSVTAAYSRLKTYCQTHNKAGFEIPDDTWPALISVTEKPDGDVMSMSWFLPPGVKTPENTDESVTLQNKPEATVYVRVFGGTPTRQSGEDNLKILREALAKAGKQFDPSNYSGASYDHYISFTHHNEVWVYAA